MRTDRRPFTAVIIGHERPGLLARSVASVRAESARYGGEIEILVVNSSQEPLAPEVGDVVRELHVPGARTAAEKRQIALVSARHPWIVSIDDDCTVPADVFATAAAAILRAPARTAALFGVTKFVGPRTFWFHCLEGTDFVSDFSWALELEELPWGPTSVSVLRRQALLEVGGFDTSMGIPAGGEDVDVCLRLRRAGWRLRGIPETLAYHTTETWNTLTGNLRRAANYGRGEALLRVRYPEMARLDLESPLLLAFPFVLVGLSPQWAGARLAGAGILVLLFLAAVTVGDVLADMLSYRKGPVRSAGLSLYRWAYRLGRWRASRGLCSFISRFDWYFLVTGSASSPCLERSVVTRWVCAMGGATFAALLARMW